jgi:mycothiol synthase
MTKIRSVDRPDADTVADVLALATAAEQADGVYPLSEDAVLRVRSGGGTLAGYAFVDASGSGELVVHPAHRRHGYGSALLAAAGDGKLSFWAHGDHARSFAEKSGFARTRVLWQMRRSLADFSEVSVLPDGVTLRHFRPGHDEQAWLAVNARAFAHHPEQGRWTVHPPTGADPAIGEIYVLGVDPGGHRRGLGKALSVAGLQHLAETGLTQAMLYVDESNAAAVALYRGLGFEIYQTDVMYARS